MMRNLSLGLLLVVSLGLVGAGCSKKGPTAVYSAELLAQSAELAMGPSETRARELLESLIAVVEGNLEEPARAEEQVRAFLHNYREELPANAQALEQELAARTGEDRIRYEENFSNYLAPTTKRWRDVMALYTTKHEASARRIRRQIDAAVSRGAVDQARGSRPAPELVPTDMDDVRD